MSWLWNPTSRWLGVEAFTCTLALMLAYTVSGRAWPYGNITISALLLLGALVGANIGLHLVKSKFAEAPWRFGYTLWRFMLEIIVCQLVVISAVMMNRTFPQGDVIIAPQFAHVVSLLPGQVQEFLSTFAATCATIVTSVEIWISISRPASTYALVTLLTSVIFFIPAARYWIAQRRFHAWRVGIALANKLTQQYMEHLAHLSPSPGEQFHIEVEETPEAVNPPTSSDEAPGGMERALFDNLTAKAIPGAILSTQEHVRIAFEAAHGQLLMLGEAGGGKSTQTYLIAMRMLSQIQDQLRIIRDEIASGNSAWKDDAIPPYPVILDCSVLDTYFDAGSAGGLTGWIVESLMMTYGLGRGFSKTWLRHGRFLPFLDSLDVINSQRRRTFLQEVNVFLKQRPQHPLAVCCRTADYESVSAERLNLRGAVRLSILDEEEVLRVAQASEALHRAAQRDVTLREALCTPMLLSLALIAFVDHESAPATDPASAKGQLSWGATLARDYLHHQMAHQRFFQLEQARIAVAWLADRLQKHDKVIFYFEDLQRDWLPSPRAEKWYRSFVASLQIALKLTVGPLYGLFVAQMVIFAYTMNNGAAATGLFGGSGSTANGLSFLRIFGLLLGLGMSFGIAHTLDARRTTTISTRARPALEGTAQALAEAILLGACTGASTAVLGGSGVAVGIVSGVVVVVLTWPLIGLTSGPRHTRMRFQRPNGGLFNAALSALTVLMVIALVGAICGGSLALVFSALIVGVSQTVTLMGPVLLWTALTVTLTTLTFGGLNLALNAGGADVMQHITLRGVLSRSHAVPRRFASFLAEARSAAALYREGGGYTFLVRSELLRDCLAEQFNAEYASELARPPQSLPARFSAWRQRVVSVAKRLAPQAKKS